MSEVADTIIVLIHGRAYKLVPMDETKHVLIEEEFSVRTTNVLRAAGITSLEELLYKSEAEICCWPNASRKVLNEINDILERRFGMRAGQLIPKRE